MNDDKCSVTISCTKLKPPPRTEAALKNKDCELSHKIALLEYRIQEQENIIHDLETSLTQRDAARIKALEDLLKERGRKIQDLKSELSDKESEIQELEMEASINTRNDREQEQVTMVAKKEIWAAARYIVEALPDPARETYDQFMFRRNLRIVFAALGFEELP